MRLLKLVWERWKLIAHAIGDVQARVLLSLFYFVIVAPFAAGVKLLSDPLALRARAVPGWLPRPAGADDAETQARRQF
jgi:hypothetical protein